MKLTHANRNELEQLLSDYTGARGELEAAVETYNGAVSAAYQEVEAAFASAEEARAALSSRLTELRDEFQEELDARSDKHRESEAGGREEDFINAYDNAVTEVDDYVLEGEEPAEVELPPDFSADIINDLPDRPSEE